MKHIVPLLLLLLGTSVARAQQYEWDDFVQEFLSDEEHAEDEEWMRSLEELKAIHEQPMNINTAGIDDLARLPFLTERQIEEIHAYIYLHGEMKTLGELRLLRSMDEKTRRQMALFTCASAGPSHSKQEPLLAQVRSTLSSRIDIPLYYRRGYQVADGYRGDPLYHRIRFDTGNRHLQAGLRIEKDPGERYYDTYGAYALLQDMGWLRRAVAGDFRAGFGEGLVMGGSAWQSKTAPALREMSGIRPMSSMDENRFLRGAALTVALGQEVELSAFVSHRKVDATLNGEGQVQTLLATGYHRTASEVDSRRSVASAQAGGNLTWRHGGWHAGATGYWQHFSRPLNPGEATYRRIYPQGSTFGTVGLHYGYTRYRLTLAGETALSTARRGLGTLHRLSWAINHRYTLSLLQRYFGRHFYSFLGTAFAENARAQNENGLLLHLRAEPWDRWQATAYLDFFHNTWPRYRMTHSSSGQELMAQLAYQPDGVNTVAIRYQLKRKEQADRMEPHHRLKVQWSCEPNEKLRLQTTAVLHRVLGQTGRGLQETVRFSPLPERLALSLTGAYFHTSDFLSRIYFYVPALYSSMVPGTFFGQGLHGAVTARLVSRNGRWMAEGRYALLRYLDRDEQSSGLQAISSPWRNDLSFQVRLRF